MKLKVGLKSWHVKLSCGIIDWVQLELDGLKKKEVTERYSRRSGLTRVAQNKLRRMSPRGVRTCARNSRTLRFHCVSWILRSLLPNYDIMPRDKGPTTNVTRIY